MPEQWTLHELWNELKAHLWYAVDDIIPDIDTLRDMFDEIVGSIGEKLERDAEEHGNTWRDPAYQEMHARCKRGAMDWTLNKIEEKLLAYTENGDESQVLDAKVYLLIFIAWGRVLRELELEKALE